MTESAPTCQECGNEIIGVEPLVIGFDRNGPLFSHPGHCRQVSLERAADRVDCRECRKPLERQADPHRPGRLLEYHRACRKAADRRRSKTWKQAAKSDVPSTLAEIEARKFAVTDLFNHIRSGRTNGETPASAKDLLIGYYRKLESREAELKRAKSAEREREHQERVAAFMHQQQQAQADEIEVFAEVLDRGSG